MTYTRDQKLTDEQREEIKRDSKDITSLTAKSVWIDRCRILLSSEQAWKEGAEKQIKLNRLFVDRNIELSDDITRIEQKFNQAIEVLNVIASAKPDIATIHRMAKEFQRVRKIAKDFLSSSQEDKP